MISVKLFAKQVEKFTVDNAPAVLAGVGVVGTLSTAFLAVKATFKASSQITEEEDRRYRETPETTHAESKLSTKESVLLVWKEYLPAVGASAVTISAIVCANRIGTKRAAALAAAYSLSDKAYNEYKEKVAEKFNANKERQVRDDIAQDRVTNNPPKDAQIIITGNGDVLCYDLPTGRYFRSNMEAIRSIQNDINQQVNVNGYAALSDFYVALKLTTTPYSEELGWTPDKLLDIQFSAVLTDEAQPCISMNYTYQPIRGYNQEPPF